MCEVNLERVHPPFPVVGKCLPLAAALASVAGVKLSEGPPNQIKPDSVNVFARSSALAVVPNQG